MSGGMEWTATLWSLAYAIALLAAYLAAGLAWLAVAGRVRDGRWSRQRGAALLRYLYRRPWYRLTRRMPRYQGSPEPDYPLTSRERGQFVTLMRLYRERGMTAQEPDRTRRRT